MKLAIVVLCLFAYAAAQQAKVTNTIEMDISMGEVYTSGPKAGQIKPETYGKIGSIKLGLFGDKVPKTVDNFKTICTRESGSYKGSFLHRVIPGFMLQGGDYERSDGTGGSSIYGPKFDDEPAGLALNHNKRYTLSMANSGPNTNGAQFFITTEPTPHLNGKHVVFGEVIDGEDVVKAIERNPTDPNTNIPWPKFVQISDCKEV